jgi:GT2 family glycosyltransferase
VSAIVPTKNRADRLGAVVGHLLAQTVAVDELVVVDQSDADGGRRLVTTLLDRAPAGRRPALAYVWDRSIDGAAAARNRGFDLAGGDIVLCVDDDMVPAPDALERLLAHYHRHPEVVAITPVITNYGRPALPHRLFVAIFCRGPFRDDRQPIYWHWRRYRGALVPVRMLGSGMLSIRRAALGTIRFDARYRGASLGEDIDLSWSLNARGGRLAIATDAHVVHDRAGRPDARWEEALLTSWGFVVDKHHPPTLRTRAARAWLVAGVALAALVASARSRSLAPLRSLRAGLRNVRRGYEASTFLAPAPRPEPLASGRARRERC